MSRGPSFGPKLFSVGEANALLPFLEKGLSDLAALRAELRALRRDIEVLSLIAGSAGTSRNPDAAELRRRRRRFKVASSEADRLNRSIEETGCLVKQVEEGLVDFFHLRGDRLVFLCWKKGESGVRYWHPITEGFAGRQPLEPHPDPSRPDTGD